MLLRMLNALDSIAVRLWLVSITTCLGLSGGIVAAAEENLVENLQASVSGEKTLIRFSVRQPTDVEVAILDAKGEVVRHLAAGVLGGKESPPLPLGEGLSQQLTWDGKTDSHDRATSGPFRVRVRAGMQVKFGRLLGDSPRTGGIVGMPYRAPVNGLAVDQQGNLYIKMMSSVGSHGNTGLWPWQIRKFDSQGQYVRTLLPYPPSTKPDQASGVELVDTAQASFTPANQNSLYPVFAVLGNELVSRIVADQLVFVHSERRELNFFKLDGSNTVRTVLMWPEEAKLNCPTWLNIQVAFSPDGRYAYYSNVAGTAYDGKTPEDIDAKWPQGRIYRHDLTQEGAAPEVFFDLTLPDFAANPYWMPSAWDKKTAASGIDVDAQGNVLVGDLVNGQVVEISPAGKLLSTTAVPWPDKVMVSRKTGDLYVISRKVSRGTLPPATLHKIASRGANAQVVAELPLTGTIGGAYTLDESGDVPVLWLAGQAGRDEADKLLRVVDQGSELVVTADDFLNADPGKITFAGYMDVDREAELVYVTGNKGNVWRFQGETGEGGLLDIHAVDVAVGPRGELYTWGVSSNFHGPVGRYTRQLEPIPMASSGENTYGYLYGRAGRGTSVCGLDVDQEGRVFATYGSNQCHVQAYDAAGKPVPFPRTRTLNTPRGPVETPVAIDGVIGYGGSIRLDPAGNIYLLQHGVPEDHQPPAGYAEDPAYRQAVGTIYKFGPQGGELKQGSAGVKEAIGAVQLYPGCGPVSRWRAAGACACTKPRFDVDEYGRLYIPNGITFTVSVRDNANNEIASFGGYGNFDCQGPQSAEPNPAIPLGWPVAAGASDRFIYVGDTLNHRVVRVDKTFASEAVLALP